MGIGSIRSVGLVQWKALWNKLMYYIVLCKVLRKRLSRKMVKKEKKKSLVGEFWVLKLCQFFLRFWIVDNYNLPFFHSLSFAKWRISNCWSEMFRIIRSFFLSLLKANQSEPIYMLEWEHFFSNFSCTFLNPNSFFQFEFELF